MFKLAFKYKCNISEASSWALGGRGGKEKCSKTFRNKERLDVKEKTRTGIQVWV